jgi:murein endopeptidase
MKNPWSVLVVVCLAALPSWGRVGLAADRPRAAAEGPSASRPSRDLPAALLSLTDEELARRVEADASSLGSLSIGSPGGALLLNAVAMPPGPSWEIASNAEVWGTTETIASIEAAIEKVREVYPDAPRLMIGDISDADGGRLKRHASHQGGRDVDLGFYYKGGQAQSFASGNATNLDLPKNWALIRALVTGTDVEVIFLDTRIQRLLYTYALSISEDKAWLDHVFQFSRGAKDALVCYERNHRTHYHVRFYNPVAQELGRRAHPFLVQSGIIEPPVYTVRHVVRPGQTMGHVAVRYGTSARAIMQANGLGSTQWRAGRAYRIPVRAAAPPVAPLVVPPRVLPTTTPSVLASVAWPTPATESAVPSAPADLDAGMLVRIYHLF